MRLHSFVSTFVALNVALGSATSSPHVIHEKRNILSGLRQGQRVDGTSITTFRIGLKQNNLENGYEYLMNISHPASPHYGKLWSAEDVRKTFAPSADSVDTVREWLKLSGIEHVTEKNGWLSFESDVARVEDLMKATYYEYDNYDASGVRIGCDEYVFKRYHLPEHVSKHVDYVTPGVTLSAPLERRQVERQWPSWSTPHPHPHQRAPRQPQPYQPPHNASHLPLALRFCAHRLTPVCLRALYDIPSPAELAASYDSSPVNSLGVFEDPGTYNQSDLDIWFANYAPEIPASTHPIGDSINGAKITQGKTLPPTSLETMLDIQVMYGLIYPQTITLYEVARKVEHTDTAGLPGFPTSVEELLDALDGSFCTAEDKAAGLDCGVYSPTRVISMSYGTAEIIKPETYLHRQCAEFLKLGLQGVTFTIASGDWGVASRPGYHGNGRKESDWTNGCIVAENYNASVGLGHKTMDGPSLNGTVFSGQYPNSCPYILSVGGTMLLPNDTILDAESSLVLLSDEIGGAGFSSSGGFSNYFSRPGFQDEAVNAYFSEHDPGYPYYDFNGVDFSKPGSNIGANGGIYNRGGRGFPDVSANGLNYATVYDGEKGPGSGTSQAAPIWASIFTLINEKRTEAGKGPVGFVNPVLYAHPEVFNDITNGTNPGCFTEGFSAVPGWDPITGLGTPKYPKLLELFLSLP